MNTLMGQSFAVLHRVLRKLVLRATFINNIPVISAGNPYQHNMIVSPRLDGE